jgi:hypothetical protein
MAPLMELPNLLALRAVVVEEQLVPTSISCSAVIEVDKKTRGTINKVIDNRPPSRVSVNGRIIESTPECAPRHGGVRARSSSQPRSCASSRVSCPVAA